MSPCADDKYCPIFQIDTFRKGDVFLHTATSECGRNGTIFYGTIKLLRSDKVVFFDG